MSESLYGPKAVKSLLDSHGFRFSKQMGQNFLIDKNIPEKIVRLSGIDKTCGVIEAGPGIGALTAELSRAAYRVAAVELDRRLLPILSDTLGRLPNVDIIQGDILKLDIKALVDEKMPGLRYHVCSNLPYNITSAALTAFISAGIFESITVMVQREVAQRICAGPGSSDYGAFSVYANYFTAPVKLFDVPPECFIPRPRVFSSVITMRSREERLLESKYEKMFFSIVRASFSQRRKTLVNALFSAFGSIISKDMISEIIAQCGLETNIRGETLSVEYFAELAKCFTTRVHSCNEPGEAIQN